MKEDEKNREKKSEAPKERGRSAAHSRASKKRKDPYVRTFASLFRRKEVSNSRHRLLSTGEREEGRKPKKLGEGE